MTKAKRTDLFGHGKGEHKVLARQTAVQLAFQPVPALVVLAPGTLAVTAGAIDAVGRATTLATIDCDAEVAGAAVDDSLDYLLVLIG